MNREDNKLVLSESRVEQAVKTFESGYNCAQSVFVTYADVFGLEREVALKMSSAMGAGVGRMREVCGVVSAMALLAGLKEGNDDSQDERAKAHIYQLVRDMSDQFKASNNSIICRELLGLQEKEQSATPSLRTAHYYATRPCSKYVSQAAEIIEDALFQIKERSEQ